MFPITKYYYCLEYLGMEFIYVGPVQCLKKISAWFYLKKKTKHKSLKNTSMGENFN